MEMIAVESSNIAAVGCENGIVRVRFKNGAEYDYPGMTVEDHAALMAAPSKGRWLKEYRNGQRRSEPAAKPEKPKAPEDWTFAVVP